MTKVLSIVAVLSGILLGGGGQSWALSPETSMLLDLLKAKGVITESEAVEFTQALEGKMAASSPVVDDHRHSVQSLADRVDRMESKKEGIEALDGKLSLSGLVEAEMVVSQEKKADGTKTKSSDLALATAQLNVDAKLNQYVSGHLAFLYEEGGGDDTIVIDEAFVSLTASDDTPVYAKVGRLYVPFGRFESHFISDPGTLVLGETNDTAVVAGYANDIAEFKVGGFKGKVKEAGKSDHINSAVASAVFFVPTTNEDELSLSGGVSYLSNLATSDSLEAETVGDVADMVGGWSVFFSFAYADSFFFDAEYLGAVKDFAAADFSFTDLENRRPEAWNLEAAILVCEGGEVALRYGGSDETGTFLSQDEYGAALLYRFFDSTSFTVEYLYQQFQDASDNSQGTVQLAVEF